MLGIVLPTALILRFPALILLAGQLLLAAANFTLIGLIRMGKLHEVGTLVWRSAVRVAAERNRRTRARKS